MWTVLKVRSSDLRLYRSISIGFQITSRLSLDGLQKGIFEEIQCEARWKDYDAFEEERPDRLAERWDLAHWGLFIASENEIPIGGMILARDTPTLNLLEGRSDLALIYDLRVATEWRGRGVGKDLFQEARRWAKGKGCTELRVETQDTNVAACRFYHAMGCCLQSIEENAYDGLDEAKLIWGLML